MIPLRVRFIVGLLTWSFAAAACSIGVDGAARPVDDAPSDLLDPTTTTATTTKPEDDDSFLLVLMYINSNGRRVAVSRPQEERPTVQDVLDGLVTPPTESEQALHVDNPITSRLLPSMAPTNSGVDGDVLRVTVAGTELRDTALERPDNLPLIYGQIVCSIVELEDTTIRFVEIFDDEGRINALPDGGELRPIEGPVGPESYNDCATAAEIAAAEAIADEGTSTTGDDG